MLASTGLCPPELVILTADACAAQARLLGVTNLKASESRSHYQWGCSVCSQSCSVWDRGQLFWNRRNGTLAVGTSTHISVCYEKAPPAMPGGKRRKRFISATLSANTASCRADCSDFCKVERAVNHCKLCRCAMCPYCLSTESISENSTTGALEVIPSVVRPQSESPHRGVPFSAVAAAAAPSTAEAAEQRRLDEWANAGIEALQPLAPAIAAARPYALAVTSVFLPHLHRAAWGGTPYASTLFSRTLPLPLRAYYDGVQHPRDSGPNFPNITWVRLDAVQPWATAFARSHSLPTSPLQLAYRRRRLKCIVVASGASATGGDGAHSSTAASSATEARAPCKDVMTVFKVASLYDAAVRRLAPFLLWCDIDVFSTATLDARFWRWTRRWDIATIGSAPPHHPETGVLSVRTDSVAGQWLVRRAAAMYGAADRAGGGGGTGPANASADDRTRVVERRENGAGGRRLRTISAVRSNASVDDYDEDDDANAADHRTQPLPTIGRSLDAPAADDARAHDARAQPHHAAPRARIEWLLRFKPAGGANDIQVMGHLMHRWQRAGGGPAAVGWFAVGCRPWELLRSGAVSGAATGAAAAAATSLAITSMRLHMDTPVQPSLRWLVDSKPYEAKRWQLCPAADASEGGSGGSVSPFNLFEYLVHMKRGPTQTAAAAQTSTLRAAEQPRAAPPAHPTPHNKAAEGNNHGNDPALAESGTRTSPLTSPAQRAPLQWPTFTPAAVASRPSSDSVGAPAGRASEASAWAPALRPTWRHRVILAVVGLVAWAGILVFILVSGRARRVQAVAAGEQGSATSAGRTGTGCHILERGASG